MKKMIIAFIMGVAIATTGSVYAEEIMSLIGTKITVEGQFPVKVNGVTVEKPAIVLFGGTSYLPVRAIGDALNMDVKFDADLGIELALKGTTVEEANAMMEVLTMTIEDADTIASSEEQIVFAQQRIKETEERIARRDETINSYKEYLLTATNELSIDMTRKAIIEEEKMKSEDIERIIEINKLITEMQAYIAKIKAKYQQ